jgi:hypothetical protein
LFHVLDLFGFGAWLDVVVLVVEGLFHDFVGDGGLFVELVQVGGHVETA